MGVLIAPQECYNAIMYSEIYAGDQIKFAEL